MARLVTAAQMKQAEENSNRLGVSYRKLMEQAGKAAFAAASAVVPPEEGLSVILLCGAGNNGGDGFVMARKFFELGCSPVVVLCCGTPKTADAQAYYSQLSGVPILSWETSPQAVEQAIQSARLIVDAVYGTGFHGSLPREVARLFWQCNRSTAFRVSVDLPSGTQADTGAADEFSFCAHQTLAMDALKPVHLAAEAAPFVGQVRVLDIGMAPGSYQGIPVVQTVDGAVAADWIPGRAADAHKGDYGKLIAVCGCVAMSGAAALSVKAALRAGAGLVTLAAPAPVVNNLAAGLLENTFLPLPAQPDGSLSQEAAGEVLTRLEGATAGLIGCGLSLTDHTRELVEQVVLGASCPMVVDADGLNALAQNPGRIKEARSPLILTPHLGEMSRLTGIPICQLAEDKPRYAREFAREYGVTLVLKGPQTAVAGPDGEVWINTTGNPGMARGGSGDVLAGIIASFLAQGLLPPQAAALGVYLHGLAGDLAAQANTMPGMLPSDMISMIPAAFAQLLRERKDG